MANLRKAYGYTVRRKKIQEISKGERPALSLKPAPYLPIQETIGIEGDPIVIKAGELVALDQWNNLVPANCGSSATVSYSETDATYGTPQYDASGTEGAGDAVETGPSPANFTLAANYCIGYAAFDMIQNMELNSQPNNLNYQPQTNQKGIVTDYLIEVPITHANQLDATQGNLVVPDNSSPGRWMPLTTDDLTATVTDDDVYQYMSNVVGKVMRIDELSAIDNLDLVETVPGLGLTGTETDGIPLHLSTAIADTGDVRGGGVSAKYKAMILIRV